MLFGRNSFPLALRYLFGLVRHFCNLPSLLNGKQNRKMVALRAITKHNSAAKSLAHASSETNSQHAQYGEH